MAGTLAYHTASAVVAAQHKPIVDAQMGSEAEDLSSSILVRMPAGDSVPARIEPNGFDGIHEARAPLTECDGRLSAPRQFGTHLTVITRPLRSALTIKPTELPISVSTAPC